MISAYAKADNEYRVAGPFVKLNFGIVEIDWTGKVSPQITLKAIDADGSAGFTYGVSLSKLSI